MTQTQAKLLAKALAQPRVALVYVTCPFCKSTFEGRGNHSELSAFVSLISHFDKVHGGNR